MLLFISLVLVECFFNGILKICQVYWHFKWRLIIQNGTRPFLNITNCMFAKLVVGILFLWPTNDYNVIFLFFSFFFLFRVSGECANPCQPFSIDDKCCQLELAGILHLACIFAFLFNARFVTLLCIRARHLSMCMCGWSGEGSQEALNIRLSHFALNMDKIYDWRSPSKWRALLVNLGVCHFSHQTLTKEKRKKKKNGKPCKFTYAKYPWIYIYLPE